MLAGAIVRTVAPADVALRSAHREHRIERRQEHLSNRTRWLTAGASGSGQCQTLAL